MKTCRRCVLAVMLIAVGVLCSVDVFGQQPRTITVLGTGSASAPPNYVVIKGTIQSDGETAEEAFKTFRELKIKVEKALAKELPDVVTGFLGEKPILNGGAEGLAMAMIADGVPGAAPAAAKKFKVSESVEMRINFETDMQRLQLAAILPKVIDSASKLGISFDQSLNPWAAMMGAMGMSGQSSGSTEFALDNPRKAQTQALEAAMDDARARATTLAGLAGGKLGEVISVEEIEEQEASPVAITSVSLGAGAGKDAHHKRPFSSDQNQPIRVRQKLRVVFDLESD
jgi:uncharacterized protein YggE